MSEGKATGISLWLSAARDNSVRQHLQKVINNGGGPSFDPHITLIALPNAPEDKLEEILSKTRKIAQNMKPFDAKFTKVQTGQIWWRSVFLEVEKTDQLQQLYNTAESQFGQYVPEKSPFYPHLSLFYGHNNPQIISNITTAVGNPNSIPIKFIDVYRTVGEADKWVHLASIPLGDDIVFRSALFINNQWERPVKQNYLPVVNPATRETIHSYPAGTSEDIDHAVAAANKAFPAWSSLSGKERAKYLEAIADAIAAKKDDFTKIEILDNGKPYEDASVDIDDTSSCFRYYANQAIQLDAKQDQPLNLPDQRFSCRIRYEPVGVAGLIIPWNYPLLMAAWKLAPCLAAGCTAVLKPSELTPLSALELGSVLLQVGLPAGVINIVTGTGPDAGEPLSKHPKVEKIAFTGSAATGSKVVTSTANYIKNVTLELGGKSPFIIFDDADVSQACEWIMLGIFANQGQVCSATSRALIQENIYDKLIAKLVEEAKRIKIGNGLQQDTKLGPIVSEGQYNKVIDYIRKGQQEGAKVITGGVPASPELLKGFFVEPTIFTDVQASSTIWNEEIFGPVLCVRKFKTEEEAVAMANDNAYGLAAAVMSKDKQRCQRVSKQLRAGIVWINCSQPTFCEAPWGGMKKSGVGRELGPWGLDNYLEVKQVTSYDEDDGMGYEKYLKKN